ncbi:hypothetical protein BGX26_004055 [Mortierella sp. AD094]|nr:hypothetical protein BGX26_004055 [Mortierella sp. AD094]
MTSTNAARVCNRTRLPFTAAKDFESQLTLPGADTLKDTLQGRENLSNYKLVIEIDHIGHDQHLLPQVQEEQQDQQHQSQYWKTFENMNQETEHLQYPGLSPDSRIPTLDKSNFNLRQNNVDSVKKGTRSSLSLQRKLDIITYWERDTTKSCEEIGRHFRVARTTVFGILKQRKATQDYIESKSESRAPSMIKYNRRMVDSRSPIVEKLLVNWLKNLKIRGTIVSDKKICTQAIEIHRLLSSFQRDRLSPCQFTTGWLKGFRNRFGASMELKSDYPSPSYFSSWATKVIEWKLDKYGTDDIYTCGLTIRRDSINDDDFSLDQSTSNSRVGEFTSSSFGEWLAQLDAYVFRAILLLVDTTIWTYVEAISTRISQLRFVKVVLVPDGLSSSLPMNTKLLKEFKAYYHAHLFNIAPNVMVSPLGAHKPQLLLIPATWFQVSVSIIKQSFQNFLEVAGLATGGGNNSLFNIQPLEDDEGESGRDRLQRALKGIGIVTELFQVHELYRYHYYTAQDGDTGPSSALFTQIKMIVDEEQQAIK